MGGCSDPAVLAVTSQIVKKVEAHLADKTCVHWPDLGALVLSHYAGKPRGPTVGVREDGTVCTRWWLGMCDFHRDPKEGPANIEEKGERRLEEYWVEGRLHRPHADGPAMIYTHYKKFDLSGEEYFEHGKWHRPSELGPAVTHWDRKGEAVMLLYCENGQHHREPKQGPAWWQIHDARTDRLAIRPFTEIRYCVRGQPHRDENDGPAWIRRDNETGVAVVEEYWRDGHFYRKGGPAIIERTPEGIVTHEAYWRGERMRDPGEGPSAIWYDTQGRRQSEAWFDAGGRHRDAAKGPGRVSYLSGGRVQEDFYVDGEYRPASLGPASITRDQEGNILWEEFWDGQRMRPHPPAQNEGRGARRWLGTHR
jgi:hypothetical protein